MRGLLAECGIVVALVLLTYAGYWLRSREIAMRE
jgi:hypothetical protein